MKHVGGTSALAWRTGCWCWWLVWLTPLLSRCCRSQVITLAASNSGDEGSVHQLIRIPGDVVFGGLFPMHEHVPGNIDFPCGAVKEEKGIQRLEAMLYAMDLINDDPNLLPDMTLGAVILDTCSSDTLALDQSMEFVRSYMNKVRHLSCPIRCLFESIVAGVQSHVLTRTPFER